MTGDTPLGPGREFDLVREMMRRWGDRARGIGDDAAMLTTPPAEQIVLSTDTSVEGIHFRREWISLEEIGWRATAAALSDLAAMAAEPLGILVALVVPPQHTDDVGALADGIGAAASEANAPIIGGDLASGECLTIAVTVAGSAAKPLTRSGAQPGDTLWVTGQLGGPALALAAWREGRQPTPEAQSTFCAPRSADS